MNDLKKAQSSSAPLEPNGANYHTIEEGNLNTQEPAFQRKFDRNESTEEKVCRICLEEDNPETMIAPCLCKGGSKWVHRECLDEWRTNERDRAFSKCTECLFEYHLEPVVKGNSCCGKTPEERRRTLFYWMVSRDACLGIVLQQLIIVVLATLIRVCDPNIELVGLLMNTSATASHEIAQNKIVWIYYAFGWFAFFIGLGLYGSIVLCMNDCNIKRSIPQVGSPSEVDEESNSLSPETRWNRTRSNTSPRTYNYNRMERDDFDGYYQHSPRNSGYSSSTTFYRRARRRYRARWYRDRWYYYWNPYHYRPTYYPMYIYPENDGCCCCCCCYESDTSHASTSCGDGCFRGYGHLGRTHSSMRNSTSRSSGNNSNDEPHIFLMILLVAAIILAIVGFFVGVVIVIVAAQRITSRHIYLLQKRQLVEEFKVKDLQDYDLDKPEALDENSEIDELDGTDITHPPPSAPVMPAEDVQYLKNLGLMDR